MATNVDGIITYRHPLIRDAAGTRGKIIRKGVGRLPPDEQERVMAELSQLLKAGVSSPSTPFVGGIGQEAFRIFWEPVFGEKWLDQYREYAKQDRNLSESIPVWNPHPDSAPRSRPDSKDARIAELESENVRLRSQIDALASVIADLKRPELSTGTPELDAADFAKLAAFRNEEARLSGKLGGEVKKTRKILK